MTIQHSAIQDADCHEPKHVTSSVVTDGGKVITPSGVSAGSSVLRQLDLSEVTVNFTGSTLTSPTAAVDVRTAILPTQAGNTGEFLQTNGADVVWAIPSSTAVLPTQTGLAGRSLVTNGSTASWGTPAPIVDSAIYAATLTPLTTDDVFKCDSLTGNVSINNPSGAAADGHILTVRLKQDATGSRTVSWGGQFTGPSGSITAASTAANLTDIWRFMWNATAVRWQQISASIGL